MGLDLYPAIREDIDERKDAMGICIECGCCRYDGMQ